MKRFIIAIFITALISAAVTANRLFISDLYKGLDDRISLLESLLPECDPKAVGDLEEYWQKRSHLLSLSVRESDIRAFSVLIAKMKKCRGEEYLSALANARLMIEELNKTESMAFFDLF